MNTFETELRDFILASLEEQLKEMGIAKEDIDEDFDLIGSGTVDSMGFMELVVSVEQKFGIEVNFEGYDLSELTTLSGFVRCCAKSRK